MSRSESRMARSSTKQACQSNAEMIENRRKTDGNSGIAKLETRTRAGSPRQARKLPDRVSEFGQSTLLWNGTFECVHFRANPRKQRKQKKQLN